MSKKYKDFKRNIDEEGIVSNVALEASRQDIKSFLSPRAAQQETI
jgi:hypothetical protein